MTGVQIVGAALVAGPVLVAVTWRRPTELELIAALLGLLMYLGIIA